MNCLKLKQAAIIGWSDGAIIGLDLAIHHPTRINKLFSFAANSNPEGVNESVFKTPIFKDYVKRAESEYQQLSTTPTQFQEFYNQIEHMGATEPQFTEKQLKSIRVPVWVVDGDHDEAIKRENTEYMAKMFPNAGLLIQPWVGHFALLQAPSQFTQDILNFLKSPDDVY